MKRIVDYLFKVSLVVLCAPLFASGAEISTRIVGGQESDIGEFPWAVSLKDSASQSHFCAGSLIAERWVLTAAHCMLDSSDEKVLSSSITATVGEYDLTSQPTSRASTIEKIFVHPDYDSSKLENDIALLKLSVPVKNTTIALANLLDTVSWIGLERPATVIGWGSTVAVAVDDSQTVEPDIEPNYPYILRAVEIYLNRDQLCIDSLGSPYTTNMICAGIPEGGKDTCQGDSGGPLMVDSNLSWQQIGIVSWGYGCGAPGYPGVYTRIAIFSDWIDSVTNTFWVTKNTGFSTPFIDSSSTQQISVHNNSEASAQFTYALTGSDSFTFDTNTCTTIDAHDSCQFMVTYTPTDQGSHYATIIVSSTIVGEASLPSNLSSTVLPDEIISRSSGSLGLLIFLLLPLIAVRRNYPWLRWANVARIYT